VPFGLVKRQNACKFLLYFSAKTRGVICVLIAIIGCYEHTMQRFSAYRYRHFVEGQKLYNEMNKMEN